MTKKELKEKIDEICESAKIKEYSEQDLVALKIIERKRNKKLK